MTTAVAINDNEDDGVRRKSRRAPRKSIIAQSLGQSILLEHIPTEITNAKIIYGASSWQVSVLNFIHSDDCQWTLTALLLLDLCMTCLELFLDAEYPECDEIEHYVTCSDGGEPSCSEEHPVVNVIRVIMTFMGRAILLIFFSELIVLLNIDGWRFFFSNVLYVMDFIVLGTAMGFEVAFCFIGEEELHSVVGLLMISRLWRLVRIGHCIFETAAEAHEKHCEVLEGRVKQLERVLKANKIDVPPEGKRASSGKIDDDVGSDYRIIGGFN